MANFVTPPENQTEKPRFFQELCRLVNNFVRYSYSAKDLEASVSDAGSNYKRIIVSDTQTLTDDLSIPANVDLKIIRPGQIVLGTYNLIISGDFEGCLECFDDSGGGAVSGLHYAEPDWWGANTTPGTTDMTAEINSALYAAAGGRVCLLDAEYYITDNISLYDNTEFCGSGLWSSTLSMDGSTSKTILVNEDQSGGNTGIKIYNMILDGNYTTAAADSGYYGIDFRIVSDFIIDKVYIKDTREFGALIRQCSDGVITNCRVESSGVSRDGFKLLGSSDLVVSDNIINSGDDCVSVSGQYANVANITIENNILSSAYASAIRVNIVSSSSPMAIQNVVISGNISNYTDGSGVLIVDESSTGKQLENITVDGNVFRDFGKRVNNASASQFGTRVLGYSSVYARHIQIKNNTYVLENIPTDSLVYGIFAQFVTDLDISGNTIDFLQTLDTDSNAIRIGETGYPVYDFSLNGNCIKVDNHIDFAINILRSQRGNITGGYISGASEGGIRGAGDVTNPCYYIELSDVHICDPDGNMTRGIYTLGTSDYWQVHDMVVRNNTGAATTLAGSNNTVGLGVGIPAANTNTPSGATAYAVPVYDQSGAVVGYSPVYSSQW